MTDDPQAPTADGVLALFDESQPTWLITLGEVAVIRAELIRLRRIEAKALAWAAYQEDDSQKDQQNDPWLRSAAIEAGQALYEAVS